MHISGAQKFAFTLHYLHTQDAAALFIHIARLLVVYSVATTIVFKSLYDIEWLAATRPPGPSTKVLGEPCCMSPISALYCKSSGSITAASAGIMCLVDKCIQSAWLSKDVAQPKLIYISCMLWQPLPSHPLLLRNFVWLNLSFVLLTMGFLVQVYSYF